MIESQLQKYLLNCQAQMAARPRIARQLRVALRRRCQSAYLFGSYGRGEQTIGSDVDLLIVAHTNRSESERFRDFLDIAQRFAPIDIIVYTPEEFENLKRFPTPFFAEIRRDLMVVSGPRKTRAQV
jgi:predicted nucleotidyltransferase